MGSLSVTYLHFSIIDKYKFLFSTQKLRSYHTNYAVLLCSFIFLILYHDYREFAMPRKIVP